MPHRKIEQIDEDSNSSFDESEPQSTLVLEWLKRFSVFNESCKKICTMLDKWTFIKNRGMSFLHYFSSFVNVILIFRTLFRYQPLLEQYASYS